MESKYNTCYIVTYYNDGIEPRVVVFNDLCNAEYCCSYLRTYYSHVSYSEKEIFKNFEVNRVFYR